MDLSKERMKQAFSEVMTVRTLGKICAVQAIIILALGVTYFYQYKRQAARLADATAFSSSQQLIIDKARADIAQRQVAMEAERKQWAAERAEIKSAAAAVKIITKYVPGTAGQTVTISGAQIAAQPPSCPPGEATPQGIQPGQVLAIAPEALAGMEGQKPEAGQEKPQTFVLQTEQAAINTAIAVQEGQQCKRELGGCQADIKDFRAQVQALELDRNKWRDTAKGGSIARRIFRGFAIGACTAGGAAIGAEKGKKGAALGSLIGAAGCAILTR